MANLNLKAVFSLIDKITAPMKKIENVTSAVGKGFGKAGEWAKGMASKVGKVKASLDEYGESAEKAEKKSDGFKDALKGLAGLAAGFSFVEFVKGFVDTGSKFEQYQATLETVLGSQAKAKAAMAWVNDFANVTPYELDQVTEAFVKLTAYGMDPMDGTLKKLGNAASGMGKDLDSAIEMMADAQQFQFERLKEFGIQSNQVGNKVIFTYHKAGKEMTKTVQKNGQDVKAALLDIFEGNFAGAMDKQSQTLAGILSNIRGSWATFQLKVDQGGVFDRLKGKLQGFMDWLGDKKNQSKINEWAGRVSDSLGRLLDSVVNMATSIDWPTVIDNFSKFVDGILKFVNACGGLKNIVDIGIAAWIASVVLGLTSLIPLIIAVAAAFFGLELVAWPITLVIAAVAALAAGAFLLWRNWDKVKKWFSGFVDWIASHFMNLPLPLKLLALPFLIIKNWGAISAFFGGIFNWLKEKFLSLPGWAQALISLPLAIISHWKEITTAFGKIWDGIQSAFKTGVDAVWNILPDWFKGMLKFGGKVFQFIFGGNDPTAGLAPARPTLPPAVKPQNPSGQINIKVDQDGRVKSVTAQSATPGTKFNPAVLGHQGLS